MRRSQLLVLPAVLLSGAAVAQGFSWMPYTSHEDYFSVSFPGEPTVEEITYPTEYRITLPARVYKYEDGGYSYSVMVVDYTDALAIHLARVESCIAGGGDGAS